MVLLYRAGKCEEAVQTSSLAHAEVVQSTKLSKGEEAYLKCYVSIVGLAATRQIGTDQPNDFKIDFDAVQLEDVPDLMKIEFPLLQHPDWIETKITARILLPYWKRMRSFYKSDTAAPPGERPSP